MDLAIHTENSAITLQRLEQNDPTLTKLTLGSLRGFFPGAGKAHCWPTTSADLARLGVAIGANTNLLSLDIRNIYVLADLAANNKVFFGGLSFNVSVTSLSLVDCSFSSGIGYEILNGFLLNNCSLTQIVMYDCSLGDGGSGYLATALSKCVNLNSVSLSPSVDDGILVEIVSGIRGLRRLQKLSLPGSNFGLTGCEVLATMLRDPATNLEHLDLRYNSRIDDTCAKILANSLEDNCKLEDIQLHRNNAITTNGWETFIEVLCNQSSIKDTHLSNHTLKSFGPITLPSNLVTLLEMNSGSADNTEAAMRKILHHHILFDMERLHQEWNLKLLPVAVRWFDRARGCVEDDRVPGVNARKLSAIFQFVRALPMMFVPVRGNAKRKRSVI